MPKFSPRVANNFMLLSIVLGNMLVFVIYMGARLARDMLGADGAQVGGILFAPGVSLAIGQICVTLLPFVAYLFVTRQRLTDVLPLRPIGPLNMLLIALITITLMPLATLFNIVTMLVLGIGNNVSEIVGEVTQSGFGLAFIIIVLMPSVFEEISLRGVVLSNYRRVDVHKAALVNGLFFGIFHLNPIQFLYAFLLGYVFALMVIYTRSIYAAIFAHLVFNGIQVLLMRFAQQYIQHQIAQGEVINMQDAASPETLTAALVSYAVIAAIFTPVAVILLKSFRSINRRNYFKEEFETRPLENDGTQNHGGLAVSTFGAGGFTSADFDTAHIKLPEAEPEHEQEDQRIVTVSFGLLIAAYIVFVVIFML